MGTVQEKLGLIANAHPQGVRLLFQEYGIEAPVTGENLENAIIVYGEPFVERLGELVYSNFTPDTSKLAPINYKPWEGTGGDTVAGGSGAASQPKKGNFWGGVNNTLDSILGLAGKGVGVWNTYKNGQVPGQSQNGNGYPPGMPGPYYPNQTMQNGNRNQSSNQQGGQSKTMLYVGLGLFVFLILLVLIVLLTKKQ